MASKKMTFSLDEETAERLRVASERLRRPKSQIVREAITDYSVRMDRLSESERLHLLRTFDEVTARIPERPSAQVEEELAELRRSRQTGGRRTTDPR